MKNGIGHGFPAMRVLLSVLTVAALSAGPAVALPLDTALSISPDTCLPTTYVEVVLSVTNNGTGNVDNVVAALSATSYWPVFSAGDGPNPSAPVSLVPGAWQAFTWTFTVSGTAIVYFAATATGDDVVAGAPTEASSYGTLTATTRADVLPVLAVIPSFLRAGDPFIVTLTLANSATEPGIFITPELEVTSAIGATIMAGPIPSSTVILFGPMPAVFAWSCSVTGAGMLELSATGSGYRLFDLSGISGSTVFHVPVFPRADLGTTIFYYPAPAAPGDWVTVMLGVSNTGKGDASLVAPVLELNECAISATLMVGPVPAGPVTLSPGQVSWFTWTYSVSGIGDISFTGTAEGIDGYTGLVIGSATSFTTIREPWARLTATLWSTPDPPALGNWFSVVMTVSNSGTGPAGVLVPFLDANPAAGIDEFISGPVPASATLLQPGERVAFTWTWSVSGIGDLAFTGTVTATDAITRGAIASATCLAVSASTKGRLVTTVTASPNPALYGSGITVTMRVTNVGVASVTGVTATMLVESGGSILVPYRSPPAMGPVNLASGAQTRFIWTYTAAGVGAVTFAATAYGSDMASDLGVWTTTLSGMSVITGGRIESQLFNLAFPAAAYGSWVDEILLVYNAGSSPALTLTPELEVTSVGSTVYLAVAPTPSLVNLPPGAYHFYTWTYSVTGAGQVDFSTTVTAVDQLSGYSISTSTTGTLYARYRAILSCTTFVAPEPAYVGQVISTRTVVTNKGTGDAWLVDPTMTVLNGGQCVSAVTAPSAVLTIPPGESTTMYWDHLAVKTGVFQYVTGMAGLDPVFGTLYAESGESVAILRPGQLSATLSVVPSAVSVGQWIRVAYTVTNSGDAPVGGVWALQTVSPGFSLLDYIDGPSGAPFTLAPGSCTVFTWTWSVSGRGAGLAVFTVTATGVDSALGLTLTAPRTARLSIASPPLLSTSMYVLSATAKQGSEVTVALTVTNIGEAPATGVYPSWYGTAPGDGAVVVGGPLPAGPVTLAAGQATTFKWTCLVTSFPALSFAATVAGRDLNTGYEIGATALTTELGVYPAPFLAVTVAASPSSVRQGDAISVTVTVSNTGEAAAAGVLPFLSPLPGSSFTVVGGPVPGTASALGPHESSTWRWTITTLKLGRLAFSASVAGTDPGDGASITGQTAGEVTITSRFDSELVLYPNPVGGDEATLALGLTTDAAEVRADAYDASMRRVYSGTWRTVMSAQPIVTITGLAKWAPGVYLIKVAAIDNSGTTRKFKVVKLEVRR